MNISKISISTPLSKKYVSSRTSKDAQNTNFSNYISFEGRGKDALKLGVLTTALLTSLLVLPSNSAKVRPATLPVNGSKLEEKSNGVISSFDDDFVVTPSHCPEGCEHLMPEEIIPYFEEVDSPSVTPSHCPKDSPHLIPEELTPYYGDEEGSPSVTPSHCPEGCEHLVIEEILPWVDEDDIPSVVPSHCPKDSPHLMPEEITPYFEEVDSPSVTPSHCPEGCEHLILEEIEPMPE